MTIIKNKQKYNCYLCKEKIYFDTSCKSLSIMYPICDDCFENDSYVDLAKIINYYKINHEELFFKFFVYKNKSYILSDDWKNYAKFHLRTVLENKRKNDLILILKEKKLQNVKSNLCNAYVKFGYPTLEYVVMDLEKKHNEKNNRLHFLIKKLKKIGKEYDEKIPAYNKYIKIGGNINKIIEESELEKQFVHNTKYLHYLEHNDVGVARYLASIEFINQGKSNDLVNKYVTKKNTIQFC